MRRVKFKSNPQAATQFRARYKRGGLQLLRCPSPHGPAGEHQPAPGEMPGESESLVMESQRPRIVGYFQWIMGYFKVLWPILWGYLPFQVVTESCLESLHDERMFFNHWPLEALCVATVCFSPGLQPHSRLGWPMNEAVVGRAMNPVFM